MSRILAFGLSGAVGQAICPLLSARGDEVLAISRQAAAKVDAPGIHWCAGALPGLPPLAGDFDAILSLGPLDRFVQWFAASELSPPRLIALGSMSRVSKRDSADADERRQAQALAEAEADLFAAGARRGTGVTVLRPTLVYGRGGEASLAPLVRFAARWHCCPFPRGASGLRQPVHVDDIAAAVMACLETPRTIGRAYDLPGGETLRLDDMVRRTLAVRAPGSRLLPLPALPMRLGLWLAGRGRPLPVSAAGFLGRRGQDQCADIGPAQRDFGYSPGPFRP